MKVNLVNYTMPVKSRSVGVMSNAVAFGNTQKVTPLQELESIGFINPANGDCQNRLNKEKKDLGLGRLGKEGINIERPTSEYIIHSSRAKFGLPQELLDAFQGKFSKLEVFHQGRGADWDYWRTTTEEGTKLLVDILCMCREATEKLVAQGKKLLAESMRGI